MLWNPLGSRVGRLVAFFLLYVTEGIPLGFTATTVATHMRKQGVEAGDVALFIGILYLPWAWKWVMGPFVDCIYSRKLGRRRAWIVGAQSIMALVLLAGFPMDPVAQFRLFVALVLVVNVFGALQDVAIDALAVAVLPEDERGVANGLMFAGAYAGQAVGGSLILFLMAKGLDFGLTFLIVPAMILAITITVGLALRERPETEGEGEDGPPLVARLKTYPITAIKAFGGSRNALLALVFAGLPTGGYALSLALQTNLSVELGLADEVIAMLALCTTIVSGTFCAIGGRCSDRWGRRNVLAVTVLLIALPGIFLANAMDAADWVAPVDVDGEFRRIASVSLVEIFWLACMFHAAAFGFMYGVRAALFMDVSSPAVAATQFTAYMAILSLVISYTSFWHGWMIENRGYPMTLLVDSAAGLLGLVPLAFMRGLGADRRGGVSSSSRG